MKKYTVELNGTEIYNKRVMENNQHVQLYLNILKDYINSSGYNPDDWPSLYDGIAKYVVVEQVDAYELVISSSKGVDQVYLAFKDKNGNEIHPRRIKTGFDFEWVIEYETIKQMLPYIYINGESSLGSFMHSVKDYLEKNIKSLDDVNNATEIYKKYKNSHDEIREWVHNTVTGNKLLYELDNIKYYDDRLILIVVATSENIHSAELVSCRQVSTLVIKHEI